MKKIIYILTFFLIFLIPSLQPKALLMGYPVVWYHENGVAYHLSNVTTDNWGGTDVYVGSAIGRISTSIDITRVDFNYFNANLCSGKTINVKGRLFGLGQYDGLFNHNASIVVYNNNVQMTCSTTIIDQNQMDFNCYSDTGGGDLSIYMSTVINYANSFTTAISRNLDVTCDVTNEAIVSQSIQNTQDIINNQNSNTNTITQNQNTNTQDIIDNQNSNTQDIINNQNQNTQQEIQSQKVCKSIEILSSFPKGYLDATGNVVSDNSMVVSPYYSIDSTSTLTLITNATQYQNRLCFYTSSKSNISCISRNQYSNGSNIPIPSNAKYFRATFLTTTNTPRYTLCTTGNQALSDDLNNLNDTLNDTSQPNTNQDINDMNDMIASDTPITDLISMPLTLINAYINGVSSSCSPINLGNLYGTDLILPCINLEQRLGSNLWGIIDAFFSIFMCYNIGMLFISAFEGITSLRDDFGSLYQPRHADTGYQPKHGGGN